MARGVTNTRMRDYYDIHVLLQKESYDASVLKSAFLSTCEKRHTKDTIPNLDIILKMVTSDDIMRKQWDNYRTNSFFIGNLSWKTVMDSVSKLADSLHF